jgi:hypothetical protein
VADTQQIEGLLVRLQQCASKLEGYTPPESEQDYACVEAMQSMDAAAAVLEKLESWYVEHIAEAQAENAKLREALERAELAMTCRNGDAHYCPNCDNTTFNAREEVRTALTETSHAE